MLTMMVMMTVMLLVVVQMGKLIMTDKTDRPVESATPRSISDSQEHISFSNFRALVFLAVK